MEARGSNGSRWSLVEATEVYETRGSKLKYVWVYESSWELPPNIVVKVSVDGSNESFRFHRQWKLPATSMYFRENFHVLPWK